MNPSFEFTGDIVADWDCMRQLWQEDESVLSGEIGSLWKTPIQHQVCLDFAETYSESKDFVISQLEDPDPRIAAYAFKILIRMEIGQKDIPPDVLNRKDRIGVHIHRRIHQHDLGKWIQEYFDDLGPEDIAEADRRTAEWQDGPLADYLQATENEEGEQDGGGKGEQRR